MSSSPRLEIELRSLAFGGEAIGTLPDGRSIFVPFGLPGEVVRVEVVEEKRRYARGTITEIVRPSPERTQPPCRHFGVCGGCDYQHIPYNRQLEIKKNLLAEQLERFAGIQNAPIRECVPSPRLWNYRNYVQFHLDPQGRVGFRQARSGKVIAIEECHLPQDGIQWVWPGLELDAAMQFERVGIREGQAGDIQVILESKKIETPQVSVEELPLSVIHLYKNESVVLAGNEWLIFAVKGRLFRVSAGAFFQVNTSVAEAMIDYVLGNIVISPQSTLLELYSGVGLFSAFLAGKVGRLVAIESSTSACEDFVINLEEFSNVELYEDRVGEVLLSVSILPDVILMDPPRSGVGSKVLSQITRLSARQIVYISCDPSTLARDGRELVEAGYQLGEITPFDMFPQTAHIESISIWNLAQ